MLPHHALSQFLTTDRKDLYANRELVKPMLEYILDDFEKSG